MRIAIGKGGAEGTTDKENSKQGHRVSAGCYDEDKKSCLRLRQEVRLKNMLEPDCLRPSREIKDIGFYNTL